MEKRLLLSRIRKEFPKLKWKTAEHNVEGWDHYVIILDNKYVFRFPRAKVYIDKLKLEISLLEYLKDKLIDIAIPAYNYIAEDKSFAGYTLIPGYQLRKKVFRKLNKSVKVTIAKQTARFLSILHKTPLPVVKKYGVSKVDPGKNYKDLALKIKKYVLPKVSNRYQVIINKYLKELKGYLKIPKSVLVHNDLHTHHILLSRNKKFLSGIIDFSDRKISDPARDFCEFWDYGRDFILEVYKHYKGPKDKDFLKRSILYYQRIPFWEMYSRFDGGRGSFKKGLKLFKRRFITNVPNINN